MSTEQVDFGIKLALLILGVYLAFFKSYFKEKGKNLATLEDVEEITTIVEKIKADLIEQNEYLKAQLSLKNQHKLTLKSAESDAFFDYNKRVAARIYSLVRFSLANYNLENFKDLKLISSQFVLHQYECDLAEAHLTLFLHDEEFLQLKKDLTISIINLSSNVESNMHKLYAMCSKCEFDIKLDPNSEYALRGKLLNDSSSVYKSAMTESIEEYKKVHPLHMQMIVLINSHLSAITA